MKRILFGIFAVAVAAAQGETDWARLNVAAREHAKTPIRAGLPGVRPFWNAHAKALADNITRNQRADGTIPTYFDSRKGSDWVNCMIYVADRLEALADVLAD